MWIRYLELRARRASERRHLEDRLQAVMADPAFWTNAPVSRAMLRAMSDQALVAFHFHNPETAAAAGVERELARRAAWSAPAAWALWISAGALLCSIAALIVSVTRGA